MPASESALARRRFRIMPDTFSVSTTTRPADLAIAVVALWWLSFRTLTVRACRLRRLAYSRSRRLEWVLLPCTLRLRAMAQMNYASHQNIEACQCRGQTGLPQIFCTTGHITECHFPFSCTEAACNHLPKYQEIGQEIGQKLETTAREIFGMAAQPQCEKCGGMCLQQITETLLVPGIDPPNGKPVFEFAVNTVCACVNIERTPGRNPAPTPSTEHHNRPCTK